MAINAKIEDELQKLNSRMERIEKKLDLIDSDRQILESIQGRLTELKEEWVLTRQNDSAVKKDIKEEIGIANDKVVAKVETKMEQFADTISSKKDLVIKVPWWHFWK